MKFAMICLLAALAAEPCFAQNDEALYFRLDFVVKELEGGKVITARNYSTTVSNRDKENSSIRTTDKVALQSAGGGYNYFDIGVNIDSRVVRASGTQLFLYTSADISSIVTSPAAGSAPLPPVVRQNRWRSEVVVPMKKATTIFSADGASEKRQMQLEVTATPLQ